MTYQIISRSSSEKVEVYESEIERLKKDKLTEQMILDFYCSQLQKCELEIEKLENSNVSESKLEVHGII